jgi:hypothetical protein
MGCDECSLERRRQNAVRQRAMLAALLVGFAACSEPIHHEIARGATAASAQYGTGADQFGILIGDEARSDGPRSLAVSDDERRVFVLDQQNNRVMLFESGRFVQHIPLPANSEVDELGVMPNGNLVLMERVASGRLIVVDLAGRVLGETAIDGMDVPEPELAGELLVRSDGVWVGYRGHFTHLMDAQGKTDPRRPTLPSLPTRDGKFLTSVTVSGISASVIVRERTGMPRNRITTLHFEHPIAHVLGFDTDASGRILLVTLHIWGIDDAQQSEMLFTTLSPELVEERHLTLPAPSSGLGVARYVAMTGSGAVYYLDLLDKSASVRRFK